MYLIDFNECQENNKAYGGMAGSKLGIIYQGEDSHIYQILGYPVHETKLGTKDNKLVVACKDFTDSHVRLQEFREIKNYYNKELEAILEDTVTDSNSVGSTSLHAVKAHLNYNSLLYMIDGMSERFWDCVMIDGLINNNDRNSGNWGILRYSDGSLALAPVFDNGASFSTKISDEKINDMLKNEDRILSSAISTVTGYNIDGKALQFGALLKLEDKDIHNAVKRVVPQIQRHMDAITAFIYAIPNADNGIEIISEIRKEFYIKGMELRLQKLLLPAYEHTMRAVL